MPQLKFLFSFPENYLGHTAKKAVITVPAYFNDSQRQVRLIISPVCLGEVPELKDGKITPISSFPRPLRMLAK